MIKKLYFLLFLNLVNCSPLIMVKREIDPQLLPYVTNWERESGKTAILKININNDLNPSIVGICRYKIEKNQFNQIFKTYYQVEININYFRSLSDNNKALGIEQVINHELGHCVKKHDNHDNSLLTDNCPASIMYKYAFGYTECYKKHRAMYWDEVRGKK